MEDLDTDCTRCRDRDQQFSLHSQISMAIYDVCTTGDVKSEGKQTDLYT